MKILKKSLLGLGMLALFTAQSSFVNSQSITTSLATGTSTTTQLPMYGLYGYTYSQQIYLSTDFNTALAGQPNLITKIRFFNVTGSLTNANSWTIYMANTTQTNFGTTTSWVTGPSLTQVFSGNLTAPAANTWMEITLDTPFLWDGVSNCNTICLINSNVTMNGNTLTATQVGASYQWLDCDDFNEPISGATAQSFTPTVSGNYAVLITDGACNSTSVCTGVTIGTSGIEEQTTATFKMFPNPANEFVTINNLTIGATLQLVDITGKVVFTSSVSTYEMNLDLNSINNGIYFVQLVNNLEIASSKKLVVNK